MQPLILIEEHSICYVISGSIAESISKRSETVKNIISNEMRAVGAYDIAFRNNTILFSVNSITDKIEVKGAISKGLDKLIKSQEET